MCIHHTCITHRHIYTHHIHTSMSMHVEMHRYICTHHIHRYMQPRMNSQCLRIIHIHRQRCTFAHKSSVRARLKSGERDQLSVLQM